MERLVVVQGHEAGLHFLTEFAVLFLVNIDIKKSSTLR